MLKWIRRYLTWLCIAIAVAGCATFALGLKRQIHIGNVMENGAQAVAIVSRAQSISRKNLKSYTIDLTWKDKDGKTRSATGVPISATFAERIVNNGVLLVPAVEIRYPMKSPTALPAIVADADTLSAAAAMLQVWGLIQVALGAFGALLFGWLLPRMGVQ